tara:strand:+ start:140 stop:559 length:420 start_codon:yes stop_codon:yes gene_type:complete
LRPARCFIDWGFDILNKKEYSILLQDKRWVAKRQSILERDNRICTKCGSSKLLHVHHIHYIDGNKPWEVPNKYLTTLCNKCHLLAHKGKPIQSFVIKSKKKPSIKKGGIVPKKNKPPLSANDKRLQARYNELKRNGKLK